MKLAGFAFALATAAAAAACGGKAARPDYPSLAPDSPTSGAAEIAQAPAPDPAEFALPVSAPRGEPIAITWKPAAVGDRRTRAIAHDALYASDWEHDRRRQHTVRTFRIDEVTTAVAKGVASAFDISVWEGNEVVDLDGAHYPETLVSGDYQVSLDADERVTVTRAGTGFPIGDREREEVQGIYGGELGRPSPLLAVIAAHPLRVGEAVDLTDAEKTLGTDSAAPAGAVHYTLTAVRDGVASYQFTFFDTEGGDVRGVKLTFDLEVATGRVRVAGLVDARGEKSDTMTSTSRMVETVTFTY